MIPYLKITAKWKMETYCRMIISFIMDRPFIQVRPAWLRNDQTGKRMELDCYNHELKLALEYNGRQHYEYTPYMHKTKDAYEMQIYRDTLKKNLCMEKNIILIIVPYNTPKYNLCSYIFEKLNKIYRFIS